MSLEAAECLGFAIVSVEDSQKLRNRQEVLQLLGQAEQFELSALLINRRIARDQLANAAGINVTNAGQIQQNFLLSFFQQAAHGATQRDAAFANRNSAVHVEDRNVAGLSLADVKFCHDYLLLLFRVSPFRYEIWNLKSEIPFDLCAWFFVLSSFPTQAQSTKHKEHLLSSEPFD